MRIATTTVVAMSLIGSMSIATPAAGAEPSTDNDPASAIISAAPETLSNLAPLESDGGTEVNASSPSGDWEVSLPQHPETGITVAGLVDNHNVEIALPDVSSSDDSVLSSANVVSYDNANSFSSTPLPKEDGSLQIITTIKSADAPRKFSYQLGLPVGMSLHVDSESGSVTALDASGSFAFGIAAPWAIDAAGSEIPTHYEVDGMTLTQIVEHDGADAFPIVADPWMGAALVASSNWTKHAQSWRLNVQPTTWARANNAAVAPAFYTEVGRAGWTELRGKQSAAKRAIMGNGMKDQWVCHQGFAPHDATWNLESWSPNVGFIRTVAARCNP